MRVEKRAVLNLHSNENVFDSVSSSFYPPRKLSGTSLKNKNSGAQNNVPFKI